VPDVWEEPGGTKPEAVSVGHSPPEPPYCERHASFAASVVQGEGNTLPRSRWLPSLSMQEHSISQLESSSARAPDASPSGATGVDVAITRAAPATAHARVAHVIRASADVQFSSWLSQRLPLDRTKRFSE
jgi:hypothetical protein